MDPLPAPTLREQLANAVVLPVLVVDDVRTAVDLGRTLVDAGLPMLEITLRTDAALASIEAMARALDGEAIVGAGTVTSARDLDAVRDAGARFAVSPGAPPALLAAAADGDLPLIPGVASATEAMTAADAGFDTLKLFPAEAAGGVALLKALAGPLPALRFCPTGGIGPNNYLDYLALDAVLCVGGSWVAPRHLVRRAAWDEIGRLVRRALDQARAAAPTLRTAQSTAETPR
ncbi:MAG: bifunctional 4-hydroxy-2-oxoglutarate aldolase/2-dehydro-3-deoxy-phosphogluconate aldolase [Acidobacteriota bacterium]